MSTTQTSDLSAATSTPVTVTKSDTTVTPPTDKFVSRSIALRVESKEQAEGAGARVRRSIGSYQLRNFDPFLLLDEFAVDNTAGFPDHPHRGFETVTFMLDGEFEHEDFVGHRGLIQSGDLQWMTAGRGIVHSEMPAVGSKISRGLQLWVNLKAKDKMCEPAYQELKAADIPNVIKDGVEATVIAGTALGTTSPVYTRTPTNYLYFRMQPHSVLHQPINAGWNAFIYTLTGSAYIGGITGGKTNRVDAHYTITLTRTPNTDGVTIETGDEAASFVLLAGEPTNEPIVQHGPFVMNTREEIQATFRDYQLGRNGFERAPGWASVIGQRMAH
jgi:redox-sensitive bicupin YhaK (pirin superfamily)